MRAQGERTRSVRKDFSGRSSGRAVRRFVTACQVHQIERHVNVVRYAGLRSQCNKAMRLVTFVGARQRQRSTLVVRGGSAVMVVPGRAGLGRPRRLGRVRVVQAAAERDVHEHGQQTDGGNANAEHFHSHGVCTTRHLSNHSTRSRTCQLRFDHLRTAFPESPRAIRMR